MTAKVPEIAEEARKERKVPTVSAVFPDNGILETCYRPQEDRTVFALWKEGAWNFVPSLTGRSGERLVPYSPSNNLLAHDVVLLPSEPAEYGTETELIAEIRAFIHWYVDVTPLYETIASYYVLLTWVYDAFAELPYLRLRGDPGSGKTRFLLTVGSLCYKPIFASGASTVSPLFRILDAFRGTLLIDEADFRLSDERAEIVKILNNGNARGFPVLRTEVTRQREFNPTAYHVFGPKIVATRGHFEDRALESRCLTEEMGLGGLREDIPISLPAAYRREALEIRNKLLLFRFQNLRRARSEPKLVDRTIEPRLAQVFLPLLSIVEDPTTREEVQGLARRYNRELVSERGTETEAQILEIVRDILGSDDPKLSVKAITAWFADRHGDEYERKITPRWIGSIMRKRLRLRTERTREGYAVREDEGKRIERLFDRYGVTVRSEEATARPQVNM